MLHLYGKRDCATIKISLEPARSIFNQVLAADQVEIPNLITHDEGNVVVATPQRGNISDVFTEVTATPDSKTERPTSQKSTKESRNVSVSEPPVVESPMRSNQELNDEALTEQERHAAAARSFMDKLQGDLDNKGTSQLKEKVEARAKFDIKITWNGEKRSYQAFRKNLDAYLLMNEMDYLIEPSFVRTYRASGWAVAGRKCPDISTAQFLHDRKKLYGAWLQATSSVSAMQRFFVPYKTSSDGVKLTHTIHQEFSKDVEILSAIADADAIIEEPYNDRLEVIPFVKSLEEAFAQRNEIIDQHQDDNKDNEFVRTSDYQAIYKIRTKLQTAEPSIATLVYDLSKLAFQEKWTLPRFVQELQQKVAFVSSGSEEHSHREARAVNTMEEVGRFHEALATRTGFIDEDTIEVLKRMYDDPNVLTKFIEARTQYYRDKRANRSIIPSVKPTATATTTDAGTGGGTKSCIATPVRRTAQDELGCN